jgi:hypothetical protein
MAGDARRRTSALHHRASPGYVLGELVRRGVSPDGAEQFLGGDVVTSARDRYVLVTIVQTLRGPGTESTVRGGAAVDPIDPSGNTIYVSGASGGVWKSSAPGLKQFLAGLPVTSAPDREALARVLAETLEQKQSRMEAARRRW